MTAWAEASPASAGPGQSHSRSLQGLKGRHSCRQGGFNALSGLESSPHQETGATRSALHPRLSHPRLSAPSTDSSQKHAKSAKGEVLGMAGATRRHSPIRWAVRHISSVIKSFCLRALRVLLLKPTALPRFKPPALPRIAFSESTFLLRFIYCGCSRQPTLPLRPPRASLQPMICASGVRLPCNAKTE